MKSKPMSFEQLKAGLASQLKEQQVAIDGLPGLHVTVRSMTARQKSEFELALTEVIPDGRPSSNPGAFRAELLRAMVWNGDTRLFADVSNDEILSLPAAGLEPLVDVCMELGGFTKRDREAIEKK